MPNNYPEFIKSLAHTNYTDEEYYSLLVTFKDDILLDTAKSNQGVVAKKLGMHSSKLSLMLHILRLNIRLDEAVYIPYYKANITDTNKQIEGILIPPSPDYPNMSMITIEQTKMCPDTGHIDSYETRYEIDVNTIKVV